MAALRPRLTVCQRRWPGVHACRHAASCPRLRPRSVAVPSHRRRGRRRCSSRLQRTPGRCANAPTSLLPGRRCRAARGPRFRAANFPACCHGTCGVQNRRQRAAAAAAAAPADGWARTGCESSAGSWRSSNPARPHWRGRACGRKVRQAPYRATLVRDESPTCSLSERRKREGGRRRRWCGCVFDRCDRRSSRQVCSLVCTCYVNTRWDPPGRQHTRSRSLLPPSRYSLLVAERLNVARGRHRRLVSGRVASG